MLTQLTACAGINQSERDKAKQLKNIQKDKTWKNTKSFTTKKCKFDVKKYKMWSQKYKTAVIGDGPLINRKRAQLQMQ